MINFSWIFALVFAAAPIPNSDEPLWVTASDYESFLFKMVPEKHLENGEVRPAFGVAYELTPNDEFKELWRVQGWYTREGYLSHEQNGRFFVRLGSVATDKENHTDLAVAFYDSGKLIKQYEVRELITDPRLLSNSPDHYSWRPAVQTKPTGIHDGFFHLVTIDKTAYTFAFESGRIIHRASDLGAKSEKEVQAEAMALANQRRHSSILRWTLLGILGSLLVIWWIRSRRGLQTPLSDLSDPPDLTVGDGGRSLAEAPTGRAPHPNQAAAACDSKSPDPNGQ